MAIKSTFGLAGASLEGVFWAAVVHATEDRVATIKDNLQNPSLPIESQSMDSSPAREPPANLSVEIRPLKFNFRCRPFPVWYNSAIERRPLSVVFK